MESRRPFRARMLCSCPGRVPRKPVLAGKDIGSVGGSPRIPRHQPSIKLLPQGLLPPKPLPGLINVTPMTSEHCTLCPCKTPLSNYFTLTVFKIFPWGFSRRIFKTSYAPLKL